MTLNFCSYTQENHTQAKIIMIEKLFFKVLSSPGLLAQLVGASSHSAKVAGLTSSQGTSEYKKQPMNA